MFTKEKNKRIRIVILLIIIIFILIIAKVFYIQVIDYDKLNAKASSLWSRNLPLKSNRGIIYDRKQTILAGNITTTSLVVIPNQIKEKEETSKKLAEILNCNYDSIYEHVSKSSSIERVHPEGRQLSYEIADKITKLNLPGVYLVKESKRYYPYEKWMAHSLGFVGIDNQGLSGLELTYDEKLTGSDGAIKYFSDAKGQELDYSQIYVEPQPGMNMTLTIDFDIQEALEREIDNAVSKYSPDQALGIVMDPNTGEILALASRPSYNPNNYQDYTLEETSRNLPVWATYEPGSTFKIITLASALEEGIIDLDNDTFVDSGGITVLGATLHCWKAGGHGLQTYLEVVENSCNPGFVNLGLKLGKETLFDYINKFGFGRKTGVDLNGEANGIIFDIDKITDLELATTAFGQGVSVTPIQQITAVSAAINGGILYKPYIVKSVNEPETNTVIYENKPTVIRKVISEETSKQVRYALESVVARGTGHNAYMAGYRVGGKTGTAQKVENGAYMVGNYITSFIGFFPANDPQVVVYIAIDNAKGVTQYGGTVAAPIAKTVMQACREALNIDLQEEELTREYSILDKQYKEVPNVVGMKVKEATKLLKDFKVEFTGTGETISYQLPNSGTQIYEGETIRLLLTEEKEN